MTAQQAIDQSILTDSIVHLAADPQVDADLALLADDSVRNGSVTEYWGEENGQTWRVHVERAPEARWTHWDESFARQERAGEKR